MELLLRVRPTFHRAAPLLRKVPCPTTVCFHPMCVIVGRLEPRASQPIGPPPPLSLLAAPGLALLSLFFLSPLRLKAPRAPPPPPPCRAKSQPQVHSTAALALHPCHLSSSSHWSTTRSPGFGPSTVVTAIDW
jgi:hypothetical protein